MSCWRTQAVLRVPATTLGLFSDGDWEAFVDAHHEILTWEAGTFAPALCDSAHGRFLDYILKDEAPVRRGGEDDYARPLMLMEMKKYLPVFQTLFPDFTMKQMYEVHFCEYTWYDGVEAPDLY